MFPRYESPKVFRNGYSLNCKVDSNYVKIMNKKKYNEGLDEYL